MQCINVFLVPATNKVQQRNNRVGHLDLQSNTFRFNVTKTQYNVYSDTLVQFKQNLCRVPFEAKLNKKLNDLLTDLTRFKIVEILLVKMDELQKEHENTTYDDSEYYCLVRNFLNTVDNATNHKEITIAATELGVNLMEKCAGQTYYSHFLNCTTIRNEIYIMKEKLKPAVLNARQILEAKINLSINELKPVILLYQLRIDAIMCESCNEKSASQLMTCGHRFCVDCIYEKIVQEIKDFENYSCIICEKMNYFISLNAAPMNAYMNDFYNQLRNATTNAANKIGITTDDADDSGVAATTSDSSTAKAKSRKRSASTATNKSTKSRKLLSSKLRNSSVYSSDDSDDDSVPTDNISVVNIDKLKKLKSSSTITTNCSVQLNSDESTDYDADYDDNIPPNQEAFVQQQKKSGEPQLDDQQPVEPDEQQPDEPRIDYVPEQRESESESAEPEPEPEPELEPEPEPEPEPEQRSESQLEPLRYDDSCPSYKEPVILDDNDVIIKKEIISDPDVIDQYYKTKFNQAVAAAANENDDDDDDDDIEFISCTDKDGKELDVRDIKLHKGFECLYRLPGTNEFQPVIMEKVLIKDEKNEANGVPALFDSIDRYMCQARNIHYTRRIERRRGIDENIIMNELQQQEQQQQQQQPPPMSPSAETSTDDVVSFISEAESTSTAVSKSTAVSSISKSTAVKSKSSKKYRQATISECNTTRLYPDGKVKFLTQ